MILSNITKVKSFLKAFLKSNRDLLTLSGKILNLNDQEPLLLADNEHYTSELIDWAYSQSPFNMMVPMKTDSVIEKQVATIPSESFKSHWVGYATNKVLYTINQRSGRTCKRTTHAFKTPARLMGPRRQTAIGYHRQ